MDSNELAKLHIIDDFWQKLTEEPLGRIVKGSVEDPDGNRFVRNARNMANEVLTLCESFVPDYFSPNIAGINSTLNDELQRVQYAQEKLSKKVTRSNKENLVKNMNNVLEHFSRDFYGVINKINELKACNEWDIINEDSES